MQELTYATQMCRMASVYWNASEGSFRPAGLGAAGVPAEGVEAAGAERREARLAEEVLLACAANERPSLEGCLVRDADACVCIFAFLSSILDGCLHTIMMQFTMTLMHNRALL